MSKELIAWAKKLASNRNIELSKIISAIEEALAISVRRQYDGERLFRVELNVKTGEQKIFRLWRVVDEVNYPTKEISLEAAQLLDPEVKIGDLVEDLDEQQEIKHNRISFTTFRQMIVSKLREFEKAKIIDSYRPYLGQIISGTVKRLNRKMISVTLPSLDANATKVQADDDDDDLMLSDSNSIEAFIFKSGMVHNETFHTNQPIKALLLAIENDPNRGGEQIVLSRAHPEFLKLILKRHIPEINDGTIEVVSIAREAGIRSKIAVRSDDPKIDVVGACVGIKSQRINAIVKELNGERIDVVPYSEELSEYVYNALSQPKIDRMIIDPATKSISVSVLQESIPAAIGKAGINTRLAKELTGWDIRVHEKEKFDEEKSKAEESLVKYFEEELNLDEESAQFLVSEGFKDIEEIAKAPREELEELLADSEQVELLQNLAIERLNKHINEQLDHIKNSSIDPKVLELNGMYNELVLALIEKNILNLEDIADLSVDEFLEIKKISKDLAQSIIMQARDICWFNNENQAGEEK